MTISNFHSKTFHLVSVETKSFTAKKWKSECRKAERKWRLTELFNGFSATAIQTNFTNTTCNLEHAREFFFSELISKNINNIQQEWTKTKSANCYLTLVNPAAASMLCFVQSLLSKLLRNYHFLENWLSWSYEWLDLIFTQSIMFGQDVWNAAVWLWRELRYEANQKSVRFIYVMPNYKKMSQSTLQKKRKIIFFFKYIILNLVIKRFLLKKKKKL